MRYGLYYPKRRSGLRQNKKNGKMPTSKRERDRRLCKHLKIFSEEQTAFQLTSRNAAQATFNEFDVL